MDVRGAVVNTFGMRNADGVSNWDDLIGPEKKKIRQVSLWLQSLGGVDVENASLNWRDATTDSDYKISNINIKRTHFATANL